MRPRIPRLGSWSKRRVALLLASTLSAGVVTATAVQAVASSPDFTLAVAPSSASAPQSATVTYTASLTSQNRFSADLAVSVTGLPEGATASTVPAGPVHLAAGGTQSVAVRVTSVATTPMGTYTLAIRASGGGKTHTRDVTYKVTGPTDFSLSITPSSHELQPGETETYAVAVTPVNGFTGTVSLALGPLPVALTGGVWPTAVSFGSSKGLARTATVTISAAANSTPNTYALRLDATSGALTHSVGFSAKVTKPGAIVLTATPATVLVPQGDTAHYDVTVARTAIAGPVALSVTGLPAGATASFAPNPIPAGSSTSALTVTTKPTTPTGDATLTVTGAIGTATGSTAVHMVVGTGSLPFTIAGDLTPRMYPGHQFPLDLSFTNPNDTSIQITDLSVKITGISGAPGCTIVPNFATTDFTGEYAKLVVPAHGSARLSELAGISQAQWPTVGWVETGSSQDACLGATLTLTYGGSAKGGKS